MLDELVVGGPRISAAEWPIDADGLIGERLALESCARGGGVTGGGGELVMSGSGQSIRSPRSLKSCVRVPVERIMATGRAMTGGGGGGIA